MIIKVGDGYRVTIPKEIRDKLQLNKGDDIDINLSGNEIILTVNKNVSSDDLVIHELLKTLENIPEEKPIKSELQTIIDSVPYGNKYWDRGILKTKTKEPEEVKPQEETTEEQDDIIKCGICNGIVEDEIKIMLNGSRLCKKCSALLKDELKRDIRYKKRVDELNKSIR